MEISSQIEQWRREWELHKSCGRKLKYRLYFCWCACTGWAKKAGHGLMTIILSNLKRFKKVFTGRFLGKFSIKWTLKISPHLTYVATLLCETLMSANKSLTTNYQVCTCIFKVWLLIIKLRKVYCSVCEWKKFIIGEYVEKLQARTWLSRALSSSSSSVCVCWPGAPVHVGLLNTPLLGTKLHGDSAS